MRENSIVGWVGGVVAEKQQHDNGLNETNNNFPAFGLFARTPPLTLTWGLPPLLLYF